MKIPAIFTLLLMAMSLVAQNPYSPNEYQYVFVDGGSHHTVALRCDGTVLCWGENTSGQLGDNNSPTGSNSPVQVTDPTGSGIMTDIIAIDAGAEHTVALRVDGTVWTWGLNTDGQLGNNSTLAQDYPVQVRGVGNVGFLTNVVAIAAGGHHSLAILDDGSVVGWGNNQGQLGDLTNTNRLVPVVMQGLDYPAIAIAGGGAHSLVLQNNGTLKACGDDFYGQLGNDNNSSKMDILVYVRDDNNTIWTGITGIDAGDSHSLALHSSGIVLSWGNDADNQIGRSTTTPNRKVALPLNLGVTVNTAVAIRAGALHSVALLADSTLVVWGNNDFGELGLGTFTNFEYPTALSLPQKVVAVSAGITGQSATGGNHTMVLLENDSAACWGLNDQGQLGNSVTGTNYNTAQKVTNYYLGTLYANAGPDQFYCNGDSVQIGGETSIDYSAYTYQWLPSLGLSGGGVSTARPDTLADPWSNMTTNSSITINYVLIKNYRYDTIGACIVPDTCKIDVRAQATSSFATSAPACVGVGVNFLNTGSSGSGVAYSWSFGNNSNPALSTDEHPSGIIYTSSGLKLVTLVVTDSICGGYAVYNQGIMVYDNPVASFSAAATACTGELVQFTNTGSSGGGWVYSWDFGAGAQPIVSSGENPVVYYTTPGVKVVTFTVSNGFCTETYTSTITVSETPMASFATTAPGCQLSPVDFVNTGSSGGSFSYQWDFGSGATPATSVMENPVGVVFSTAGLKTVRLIITNAGCADTITQTITIHERPVVSFTSTAPVCEDEGVNFANTGSTGNAWSYFWDFGAGAMPQTSTAENPTGVMYSMPGTKTVTFTISNGNCTETFTSTITINETPVADFTSTAPECTGLAVDFTNIGTSGAGWSYSWNFGSGATPATSALENPTGVVYSTAGTKLVTLTVSNANCSNTITIPIDINETPSVSFTSNAPVCQDDGVDFTNTGSTGSAWTYFWDFGAGAMPQTSSAENPMGIMYATPGVKTVTFTISNGSCTETYTNTVTINETPEANFTSTAPECTGLTVDFTNIGTSGAGWSYSWNFGSGATPSTSAFENPTGVVYSTAGTKLVTLTVSNANCSNTITIPIDINETPSVSFTSNAPVCQDDGVDFTNTGSTGSAWTYFWDFGAGAMPQTSSAENPTGVMYSTPGVKTVTFTISNGSCTETYTNTVTINETPMANFTSTAPECTGLAVDFTNTGTSGAGWNYSWNFGSGATPATSALENPSGVVYSTAGVKLVTLTISNANCSNTITIPIDINETPSVSFTSTAPVCQDDGVDFTNTGSTGSAWTYFWDFGAGAMPQTSSAENPTGVMYSTPGVKTVTFTISNGYCTETYTNTITINETPVANFTSTAPECTGLFVDFTNTGSTGAGYTYSWNFGTGATPATSTAENPSGVSYCCAGTKLVTLTVSNSNCSNTITIPIDINETPTVTFNHNAPVCMDAGVNFTNGGSTGSNWSYSWDFGADAMPQTSNSENPSNIMYATPGSKTVTFTISNGYCSETYTNTIMIYETPVANFTSTAPQCTGLPVDFTNTGSTGTGWSYSWDFGPGATPATSTLENPVGVIYSSPGTKLVTLTVSSTNCTNTIIIPIDINETPSVSFSSNAPVCMDAGVNFTNTGSTGFNWNYSWDFGSGAVPQTSSSEDPSAIMYLTPGSKTVTFTISDGYCTETYTNSITIYETPVADFTSTAPECTGLPVDFTNTGTTGGVWTYSWNFGSGATPATSTLENPTGVVYSTSGVKLVELTISDGNCSHTITKTIDINLTPTVSFSSNAPVCRDAYLNLMNTGSSGSNWAYSWNFGLDAMPANSTSENPVGIMFGTGGYKEITFTIYDGYCIATHTDSVMIYDLPLADAGPDTTICADRSVMIGTPAMTNYSYTWFPNSTLDNGYIAQPVASPIANQTNYIVKVTDGATMCVNYDSILVTMLPPLVADAGTDVEICLYDSVQIGAALVEGQVYNWTPVAGINGPALPSPWVSPDTTTTYLLTVTGTASGCDPVTDEVLVIVHPLPLAEAGPDDTITTAESTQLFATGGVQYEWSPDYELSNNFIHNPVASPDMTTEYFVLVTDVYGCKNIDSVTIVVYEVELPYWLPTAFTPNMDGHNDILYVRGDEFESFEFSVYNRYGELIFYTQDIHTGWDGRVMGSQEEAPIDAYLWKVSGRLLNGEVIYDQGLINLIR